MDIQKEFESVKRWGRGMSNTGISPELHKHIRDTFRKVDNNDRAGRTWYKVYNWNGDSKYGAYMISIETQEWRNTTMSEFYGCAVVD